MKYRSGNVVNHDTRGLLVVVDDVQDNDTHATVRVPWEASQLRVPVADITYRKESW